MQNTGSQETSKRGAWREVQVLQMPQAHSNRPVTPSPRPPKLPGQTRRDTRRAFACSVRKAA